MSGLVIKLAPFERVLINGAVIENGERRSKIAIKTPHAHILRLKDAIHPDAACTPVSRVCYVAQLVLSGDAPADEGARQLRQAIRQIAAVFDDAVSRRLLTAASEAIEAGNFYLVLRHLRGLLPREAQLLSAGTA